MTGVRVRRATEADAEAIVEILGSLGWFDRFRSRPGAETRGEVREQIARGAGADAHTVFVAEVPGGAVTGYAAVHWLPTLFLPTPEGYLAELFVAEGSRGQGIGSALLEAVLQAGRDRGCSRLTLLNSRHRESYERAFYPKRGWVERPAVANLIYTFEDAETGREEKG